LEAEKVTSISVVIPLHNEEKRIPACVHRLLAYFKEKEWDFELIFVQDDSTDNTSSILHEFSLTDSHIRIINIPTRVGKGGAIMYSTVIHPTRKYIAYLDVDLAADPCELEKLLEYIDDYDMVIGSRILRGNLLPIKRSFHRSLLSRLYSKLFRMMFRIPVYDPQCGFKLIRREIILKLFQDVMITDFAFDTDLIVTAFTKRLRIKEIPINWKEGKDSTVSIPNEIRAMGIDLLSIWYRHHVSWRQGQASYPQKRGSTFGRVLFSLLSLSNNITNRHLRYLESKSLINNQIKDIIETKITNIM
jgi:glycosyltransferase involved in cell wall biosynthesis